MPPAGGHDVGDRPRRRLRSRARRASCRSPTTRGRDAFWAVGSDGLSIYLLTKTGAATLVFTVDPVRTGPASRPACTRPRSRSRTTAPTTRSGTAPTRRRASITTSTTADALGTAQLVSASPYIDVGLRAERHEPRSAVTARAAASRPAARTSSSASAGCNYLFEYTKTGTKVAWYAYNTYAGGKPAGRRVRRPELRRARVLDPRRVGRPHPRLRAARRRRAVYGGGPAVTAGPDAVPGGGVGDPVGVPYPRKDHASRCRPRSAPAICSCASSPTTRSRPSRRRAGWTRIGTTLNGTRSDTSRCTRKERRDRGRYHGGLPDLGDRDGGGAVYRITRLVR